jgi:hypothetical protein
MMKTTSKIRAQGGAAMIEFAIVLPVFLILLIGTVEFTLLLYNKAMITNASREGARLGIVLDSYTDTHPSCDEVRERAEKYVEGQLIPPADPTITSCIYPMTQDPAADPCPADCSGFGTEGEGDFLKVEVNYTYDFLVLDSLFELFGFSLESVQDLQAVAIMRFE